MKPQNNYLFNRVFVNNNTSRSKNPHSNHACKLMLEAKTTVLPVESSDWSGDGGFKFIAFSDLLAKNLEEGVSADVIGMVTKFSEEKQYGNTDDEQSKYRVINLRDLEGLSLSCTLWGKFMRLFYNYVNSEEEKQCVILIIQFGKTKKHGDHLTVRSDWNFTQVLLDVNLQVVTDFRKRYLPY
ncbi:replication protein A 70 kDa DNA-binding subunit A-like [Rutidosis leptorrhynchoides]|uniref:replication protein A 70 kDa DNA-binding subunit A-like n=1 Tax=Rutidosis leptorrhynchoides TaxID=125765 RepID=UPI003A999346